jgi:DNA-binding MarR family transcriptional regulator
VSPKYVARPWTPPICPRQPGEHLLAIHRRTVEKGQNVAITTIRLFFAGLVSSHKASRSQIRAAGARGTVRAQARCMNAHFFGTKRAFHGILRIMRKPLGSFGLTAARYDMLYAIFGDVPKPHHDGCLTLQSELPRQLGVHKSVVSRMLRSLEQIGLVARGRSFADRRKLRVWLTEAGRERLHDAARCLARASRRLLCMAICFGRYRDAYERFRHMSTYDSYLRALRRLFGDTAWVGYRWQFDD